MNNNYYRICINREHGKHGAINNIKSYNWNQYIFRFSHYLSKN